MQKLLILGTHTLAEHLSDVISEIPGYEVVGFVENMDPERCLEPLAGLPVLWVESIGQLASTHKAVCGLGTTQRERFVTQVSEMGLAFETLVHPSAWISSRAEIGMGCFVNVHASVATAAVLGEQIFVNRGAMIGHHTRIGAYSSIQSGANIAGNSSVGDHTYVGMGAVILDHIKIGSGCIIGAGSVVTRDLPDAVKAAGVPATIIETGVERK